ncbi:MAG: sigma factor [Eubacterium sp.]
MDIQTIYERQCSRVYRIAMLYLKNTSDAEDAVQNIFLKYMEKKPSFCDENHEKAWFITVTGNYCKDILRTFWRRKVDFVELPGTGRTAE